MRSQTIAYCTTLMIFVVGCQAKTGDVEGIVRFEGQALPNGRIVFYSDAGDQPVLMSPIVDGGYKISEAPVGDAKITIETFETKTAAVPGQFNSPVTEDETFSQTQTGQYLRLPDRYGSPGESNLSFTINAGSNSHDIDLDE